MQSIFICWSYSLQSSWALPNSGSLFYLLFVNSLGWSKQPCHLQTDEFYFFLLVRSFHFFPMPYCTDLEVPSLCWMRVIRADIHSFFLSRRKVFCQIFCECSFSSWEVPLYLFSWEFSFLSWMSVFHQMLLLHKLIIMWFFFSMLIW